MSTHEGRLHTEPGAGMKKRYVVGAGAAACAVCCAAPILAVLGLAGGGLAATVATLAFAGTAFGLVVLAGTILALFLRRRHTLASACDPSSSMGPVEVSLSPGPSPSRHRDPGPSSSP